MLLSILSNAGISLLHQFSYDAFDDNETRSITRRGFFVKRRGIVKNTFGESRTVGSSPVRVYDPPRHFSWLKTNLPNSKSFMHHPDLLLGRMGTPSHAQMSAQKKNKWREEKCK
jgi:hypothetical protein